MYVYTDMLHCVCMYVLLIPKTVQEETVAQRS